MSYVIDENALASSSFKSTDCLLLNIEEMVIC